MAFTSSVFRGVKKVVKTISKNIKKVGKTVWKGIKKVGGSLAKGVSKLGPIAMIGSNFIPGVGSFFSSMWSSFGNSVGEWATSGNALTSAFGKMGNGAYEGVNWVRGTAGSITSGISEGFKAIGNGNFQDGIKSFGEGFQSAFTGKGGTAGVAAGRSKAFTAGHGALNTHAIDTSTRSAARRLSLDTTGVTGIAPDNTPNLFGTDLQAGSVAGRVQIPTAEQFGNRGAVDYLSTGQAAPGISEGVRTERAAQGLTFGPIEGGESNLSERLLGAAASGLQSYAQQKANYIPSFSSPAAPQNQNTGQLGVVGRGSAGGGFLDKSQLNSYTQYWNRSLGIGKRVGGTV